MCIGRMRDEVSQDEDYCIGIDGCVSMSYIDTQE